MNLALNTPVLLVVETNLRATAFVNPTCLWIRSCKKDKCGWFVGQNVKLNNIIGCLNGKFIWNVKTYNELKRHLSKKYSSNEHKLPKLKLRMIIGQVRHCINFKDVPDVGFSLGKQNVNVFSSFLTTCVFVFLNWWGFKANVFVSIWVKLVSYV